MTRGRVLSRLRRAGFILAGLVLAAAPVEADSAADRLRQARRILDEVPLIDGHNDAPWQIRQRVRSNLDKLDYGEDLTDAKPRMHSDLPRLQAGGVGAQFWSVYVPVDLEGGAAVQAVIEQIDLVHRMTARYDALEMAYTAKDVERIHANGKIASLIGMEGGHSIGNSLSVLRQTYALGARYMTITHSKNTGWADAATYPPEHDGLTRFGQEVIREMNRLGMIVDLSHVSAKTMHDALDVTAAPILFTHSSARAITQHPRNVPDDVLKRLPENGGVVMVTFVTSFVSEEVRRHWANRKAEEARLEELYQGSPEEAKMGLEEWDKSHPRPRATLSQVADHIDHVRKIAGVDYIGIGSDFDGIRNTPDGLEDASKYPHLFAELLHRGYSPGDLKKIAGLNVLRVMRAVEKASTRLRQERGPSQALIDELDG